VEEDALLLRGGEAAAAVHSTPVARPRPRSARASSSDGEEPPPPPDVAAWQRARLSAQLARAAPPRADAAPALLLDWRPTAFTAPTIHDAAVEWGR
jgi:hypothetical protein